MLDAWTKAALLEPPLICGRRLLPLSPAHTVILSAIGSPAWVGGALGGGDVLMAVHILSMDWRHGREWLSAGCRLPWLWASRWALRRGAVQRAGESLLNYLDDATHCPTHAYKADGAGLKAPWQWHMVATLMSLGMSEDEAWNCPLNRAACLCDTKDERDGGDTLVDEKTARGADLVAKANAEPDEDRRRAMYEEAERLLKRC